MNNATPPAPYVLKPGEHWVTLVGGVADCERMVISGSRIRVPSKKACEFGPAAPDPLPHLDYTDYELTKIRTDTGEVIFMRPVGTRVETMLSLLLTRYKL